MQFLTQHSVLFIVLIFVLIVIDPLTSSTFKTDRYRQYLIYEIKLAKVGKELYGVTPQLFRRLQEYRKIVLSNIYLDHKDQYFLLMNQFLDGTMNQSNFVENIIDLEYLAQTELKIFESELLETKAVQFYIGSNKVYQLINKLYRECQTFRSAFILSDFDDQQILLQNFRNEIKKILAEFKFKLK